MKKGVVYALIAIFLWGTTAAVVKLLLASSGYLTVAFYIVLFSTITLLLSILALKKTSLVKRMFVKEYKKIIFLGIIGIGLYELFYVGAFANAPAAQANVLQYLWPIFIMMFSLIFYRKNVNYKILLSFLLGFIGAAIVITGGNVGQLDLKYSLGYVFAILAALCWALFSVLNKKYGLDPMVSLFFYHIIGLLFLSIAMLIFRQSLVLSFGALLGAIYIGALTTAVGYLFWLKAVSTENTLLISNLAHITPFLSLLFIFIILKEEILINEIIGLLVIVSGILLQIKTESK